MPLDNLLDRIVGRFRRRRSVSPTTTLGAHGTATYGGYVENRETRFELSSREERYRTYSDILANTSIVAAGVRYFLNLIANAGWSFYPSEADGDKQYAERAEEILTDSPLTPYHRIVRRSAMYRFYGFSLQEWTAARHPDGWFTFLDIAPRSQITVDRWDIDLRGEVIGVIQRHPRTQQEIYLPREKLVYIVDDSLNDSPEGFGLFRHLVEPAKRLQRYEDLEQYGFETDLSGIPIVYAPIVRLLQMVQDGKITKEQYNNLVKPAEDFARDHIRNPKLSMLLDSARYESADERQQPTNNKQWEVDLLTTSSNSFAENAQAIERINHEIARVLGVEQLLLGGGEAGSMALSREKSHAFYLLTDGALTEIRETYVKDLLDRIWMLNGWNIELKPIISTDAIRFTDASEAATVLRDMASAGAILEPDDPAINDLRDLIGVRHADLDAQRARFEQEAMLDRRQNEPNNDNG